MKPVCIDKNLYWTANTHAWEMLDMDYLSAVSLDGLSPKQRILESGYPAQTVSELIRPLSTTNPVDGSVGAGINFERLLRREFDQANLANRKILNPVFSDAGPAVISSTPSADPEDDEAGRFDKYFVNLLVCDIASKTTNNQAAGIYGWVYYDENLNGLFDPEEGMVRASVDIRDKDGKMLLSEFFTDNAGGFQVELPSGEYLVMIDDGEVKIGRRVHVDESYVSLPIRLLPVEDELQN
jgi:hypothetical protein